MTQRKGKKPLLTIFPYEVFSWKVNKSTLCVSVTVTTRELRHVLPVTFWHNTEWHTVMEQFFRGPVDSSTYCFAAAGTCRKLAGDYKQETSLNFPQSDRRSAEGNTHFVKGSLVRSQTKAVLDISHFDTLGNTNTSLLLGLLTIAPNGYRYNLTWNFY